MNGCERDAHKLFDQRIDIRLAHKLAAFLRQLELQYFSFCFDELSIGLGSCRAALGTTQPAQISDTTSILIKFAIGQLRNHMLIDKLLHTLARQIEVFSELGGYDGIAAGNLVLLRPGG